MVGWPGSFGFHFFHQEECHKQTSGGCRGGKEEKEEEEGEKGGALVAVSVGNM